MWNIWQKCFTENELCGCGKPFQECEFWRAVVQEAFGGFDQVDLEGIKATRNLLQSPRYFPILAYPRLRSTQQTEIIKAYQEQLTHLYSAIQSVSRCRVIIDSSKGPRYAMLLNEISAIDLRLVHLARDSRAVVYSWQKKVIKPEVVGKTTYMDRPNPVSAALNWNVTNLLTQSFVGRDAGYSFLRYEELIASPDRSLNKIAHFAGESIEERGGGAYALGGDGEVNLATDHTAVGNPNRFRQGRLSCGAMTNGAHRCQRHRKVLLPH